MQAGALAVQLATIASIPSLTVPAKVWASLGAPHCCLLATPEAGYVLQELLHSCQDCKSTLQRRPSCKSAHRAKVASSQTLSFCRGL